MTYRTRTAFEAALLFGAITAIVVATILSRPVDCALADAGCEVGDNESFAENMVWASGTAFEVELDHAATAGRTITFPDATDTLVMLDETQTLTNKTLGAGNTVGVALTWSAAQDFATGTTVIATADINSGTMDSVSFNAGSIGAGTPSTGAFTSLSATGGFTSARAAAQSDLIITNVSDVVTYNVVSLNGVATHTGHLGMMGGATGDDDLLFNAPTGGAVTSRIATAIVLKVEGALITASQPVALASTLTLTDGGTVSQITSKATGVTLNTNSGQITMHNAALNDVTAVTFVVTNSTVAATDVVIVNHGAAGTSGAYLVTVSAVGAGSFAITVYNVSGGALGEAIVINFAVLGGASS